MSLKGKEPAKIKVLPLEEKEKAKIKVLPLEEKKQQNRQEAGAAPKPIQEEPEGKFGDDPNIFVFEHFFSDLMSLITKPKEIAPRLADAPYNPIFLTCFVILGLSIGFRKLIYSYGLLDFIRGVNETAKKLTLVELGQRDAALVIAIAMPIMIVVAWYIAAFAIDRFAEIAGGYNGSYSDIKSVLGYMGILVMFFDILITGIAVAGEIGNCVAATAAISKVLYIFFGIWMIFIGTFCVESIYGMPMSYSGMIFSGVIIAILLFYYMIIYFMVEKFMLSELFKGKYEIRQIRR